MLVTSSVRAFLALAGAASKLTFHESFEKLLNGCSGLQFNTQTAQEENNRLQVRTFPCMINGIQLNVSEHRKISPANTLKKNKLDQARMHNNYRKPTTRKTKKES